MILQVFCLYDNKSENFNNPIIEKDISIVLGEIKRVSEDFEAMNVRAIDYELFELGTFDTENGHIETHEAPRHIMSVAKIVAEPKEAEQNEEEEVKENG